MLAPYQIRPPYNIGTTSVKSALFQGAHFKDRKNPRKLFTNAEEILFVLFLFVFRSTESAVSEHYHRG